MNASESYVIIATAKPMIDAAKRGREQALGASSRSGDTTEPTGDPDDQPEPSEDAHQSDVEERPEPLVVEDRGVSEGIVGSGLSRAQTLPEQRPAHAFCEPRLEVGAPIDERRITRKCSLSSDQTGSGLRKEGVLQRRDRSRSDDLDDDQHRNHQRQERQNVTWAEPQQDKGGGHDRDEPASATQSQGRRS